MSTETISSLALGVDSEMDVKVLDINVDVSQGAAADTSALKPEHEPQSELQTLVLPTVTSTTKKPAPREKQQTRKDRKETEQATAHVIR